MLVLLPPSETKAEGVDRPPLDLGGLSFPALTRTRRALLRDVVRLAKREPDALRQALGLSERQRAELIGLFNR